MTSRGSEMLRVVGSACGLLRGGCVGRVAPVAAALAVVVALLAPVDDVLALPADAGPAAAAPDLSGRNNTGPPISATRTLLQPSGANSGFKAVTVGGFHSCGLRSNDTITCWGNNDSGQADAPAGTFKAVSAGGDHSCGLRSNDTITCWGYDFWGQADAPAGTFKAVSAGSGHSCGLRSDDTITCWGDNSYGQADAPEGTFKAVSAGSDHSCGLRSDGVIVCWGGLTSRTADPVGGVQGGAGVQQPAVDALHELGVLKGTGCVDGGGLCPSEPLRRWEMAVWLVRVLDDDEPQGSVSRFDDVDGANWWAPYTERLAELAVTRGCKTEPLRFCPEVTVNRGQMAVFLVRAFELDDGPPAGFVDVAADHTFVTDIDALAASRVTVGCKTEPLRFCPADAVTRGQMATFLARALGLIETPV